MSLTLRIGTPRMAAATDRLAIAAGWCGTQALLALATAAFGAA
jgi:hypothetical protein